MRNLVVFLGLGLLLAAPPSFASLSSQQKLEDFSELVTIVKRNYAALLLKKDTIGLDFPKTVKEFEGRIANSKNDAEFYRLLTAFLAAFKDGGHVHGQVPSTFSGKLGFTCAYIEGKVLIDTIDRALLPESRFPFQRGDELISFDGIPVSQVLADLEKQSSYWNPLSTVRTNTGYLTERFESSGMEVPRGPTLVAALPKGAAQPIIVSATWVTSGKQAIELDDLSNLFPNAALEPAAFEAADPIEGFHRSSLFNGKLPEALLQNLQAAGMEDVGSHKTFFKLPDGFKPLPTSQFTAGSYEVEGKKIGLLRIPSYPVDGMEIQFLMTDMMRAVKVLNATTDVLVIDQTNNPGGTVQLVPDIVALFANKSFIDVNFAIRPSLDWVAYFDNFLDNVQAQLAASSKPSESQANSLLARAKFLSEEMRTAISEKQFLTRPVSLNSSGDFGIIQPDKTANYEKPILLLINEFDASSADMFPAIMKQNGRATLFGTTTMGAGGNVAYYGPLAHSAYKFSLTQSLMVLQDGSYVEDKGVSPDIAYDLTEDDFLHENRSYVKAFTVEALKLAGATPEQIQNFTAK